MEKQIAQKLPVFTAIIIISILLFNDSCSKETKGPNSAKPTPDRSPIVYADVKPDSVILKKAPDFFSLDLNNDGIIDFDFRSTKLSFGAEIASIVSRLQIYVVPRSGGIMTNIVSPTPFFYPPAFDSSTVIAPGSLWASTPAVLLYGATSLGYINCMMASGYWLNVSDKYLGLKFIKGNSTYYGWARLTSSYSAVLGPYRHLIIGQLTLKDYA